MELKSVDVDNCTDELWNTLLPSCALITAFHRARSSFKRFFCREMTRSGIEPLISRFRKSGDFDLCLQFNSVCLRLGSILAFRLNVMLFTSARFEPGSIVLV